MKWSEIIKYYERKLNETANSKESRDKYVAINYRKIIATLSSINPSDGEITDDAINNLAITDYMKSKLKYFRQNPREVLKYINGEQKDEHKIDLKTQLLEMLGIGSIKADELIAAGLKTIAQLKKKKFMDMLPASSQTFLQYQPERKIPHEIIQKIEPAILSLCDQNDGCISTIILGSYRRRLATSRDIDVMLVSDNPEILNIFLRKARITFGKDNVIPYANGPDKMSLLIRFNNIELFKSQRMGVYKLDIFRAPSNNAAAMMLYATGSKEHNILMRRNAKNKNMLLNQDGLYERDTNKLIPTNSEKDIFEKIGMEYKEPHERN